MKARLICIALLISVLCVATSGRSSGAQQPTTGNQTQSSSTSADVPKGTTPRASADGYPAHTVHDGLAIGAVLLTLDQVHKIFNADLNRCCRVVEVAVYPQKDKPINISLDDFGLRIAGSETASKPLTAELLSSKLQKKPAQSGSSSNGGVVVEQTSGIGYQTGGIDPSTGMRRQRGVVTSSGAGVGVGIGGSKTPVPNSGDRSAVEALAQKGLAEGTTTIPVAGYLYFELQSTKDKKTKHQLEYWLNAEKIVLELP